MELRLTLKEMIDAMQLVVIRRFSGRAPTVKDVCWDPSERVFEVHMEEDEGEGS